MNPDDFLVRPHREHVERFREGQAWQAPTSNDCAQDRAEFQISFDGADVDGHDVSVASELGHGLGTLKELISTLGVRLGATETSLQLCGTRAG